jgi:hypothetical protein
MQVFVGPHGVSAAKGSLHNIDIWVPSRRSQSRRMSVLEWSSVTVHAVGSLKTSSSGSMICNSWIVLSGRYPHDLT